MSKSRLELKVGLFVFFGLVLAGLLLLQFNKGASLFRPTYTLNLVTENAGGLKPRAGVLMSGVQIGSVDRINLALDGKSVTIVLKIYKEFVIRDDARFAIEQSGFLGDNFVAIDPLENRGKPFENEGTATALEPFNLLEVARSAAGFIERMDSAATKLDGAISDIRRQALNEQTLTNLAATVTTMRAASEKAMATVDEINNLLLTNGPIVSVSASNIAATSDELRAFARSLNGILATNQPGIAGSVRNIEASTVLLKDILADAHSGKGLAGALLHNEQVAADVSAIVNNLSVTTSNLNRLGLWGILWSQKPAKTDIRTSEKLTTPKNPYTP